MKSKAGPLKEDKLNLIYRTALRLFSEYGFKKTTVEDIANELGMVKGNLYLYVKNKKELYEKAIEYALVNWQVRVIEAMKDIDDFTRRFEIMCVSSYEYLQEDKHLRKLAIKDPGIFSIYPGKDRFGKVNRDSLEMLKDLLKQGVEKGEFIEMDIESTAKAIFSVYNMFIIKTYVESERKEVEKMFHASLKVIVRGLKSEKD